MNSIREVEQYLERYVLNAAKYTGKDITVERMWSLLERVGSPDKQLRVVHIAGTSGKTSTAYFMSALLGQTGKRVGLTVSPHVSNITERLQLNGVPISEREFCELFNEFMKLLGEQEDASYFELMIVFILWSFVRLGVEYAVVETGMGGLHDSTNVLQRQDKVCIITDIGFDHQHVLGNTIEAIATQKAGIIHAGNHVFAYDQNETVTDVLKNQCRAVNAELHMVSEAEVPGSLPLFQQRNWHLAHEVYAFIAQRDGLTPLTPEQLKLTHIDVPGRMHIAAVGAQTFILDGAHNAQKMEAFIASFRQKFPVGRIPVLLAMKTGKEFKEVTALIRPVTSSVICTEFRTHQDLPIHAIAAHELAQACRDAGIEDVVEIPDMQEAVAALRAQKSPLNLITGSFYLVGDALKLLAK